MKKKKKEKKRKKERKKKQFNVNFGEEGWWPTFGWGGRRFKSDGVDNQTKQQKHILKTSEKLMQVEK